MPDECPLSSGPAARLGGERIDPEFVVVGQAITQVAAFRLIATSEFIGKRREDPARQGHIAGPTHLLPVLWLNMARHQHPLASGNVCPEGPGQQRVLQVTGLCALRHDDLHAGIGRQIL